MESIVAVLEPLFVFIDALSGEKMCNYLSCASTAEAHITCSLINRLMFCQRDKGGYIRQATKAVHS